jgi:hypothetical protein
MSLCMCFTSHRVHKAVLKTGAIIPVKNRAAQRSLLLAISKPLPQPYVHPLCIWATSKIVAICLHKTNHRDKRRYFDIIVGATRSVNLYYFALPTRTNSCIFMSLVFCRHTNIEARFSALRYKTKRWRTCNAVTSNSGHAWFRLPIILSLLYYFIPPQVTAGIIFLNEQWHPPSKSLLLIIHSHRFLSVDIALQLQLKQCP